MENCNQLFVTISEHVAGKIELDSARGQQYKPRVPRVLLAPKLSSSVLVF